MWISCIAKFKWIHHSHTIRRIEFDALAEREREKQTSNQNENWNGEIINLKEFFFRKSFTWIPNNRVGYRSLGQRGKPYTSYFTNTNNSNDTWEKRNTTTTTTKNWSRSLLVYLNGDHWINLPHFFRIVSQHSMPHNGYSVIGRFGVVRKKFNM